MNSKYYPKGKLADSNRTYSEAGLLTASNEIVVLAETGGGKMELMRSQFSRAECTAAQQSAAPCPSGRSCCRPLIYRSGRKKREWVKSDEAQQ